MAYYRCDIGGGSPTPSVPDWSQIGLNSTPSQIIQDFNNSKTIYDNWDSTRTSYHQAFTDGSYPYFGDVDMTAATNCSRMFQDNQYKGLQYIYDISLPNVTIIDQAFYGCYLLRRVDNLTIGSNATTMNNMLDNCKALVTAEIKGASNASANINYMFSGDENLINVNIPNMAPKYAKWTFANCTKLPTVTIDTTNLEETDRMFLNCYLCNPTFTGNFNNLKYPTYMFEKCYGLTSFTSSLPALINADSMFLNNSGLQTTNVTGLTSTVTNLNSMYSGCSNLTSATISGTNVTPNTAINMFRNCSKLVSASITGIAPKEVQFMFLGDNLLEDINVIDTSRVTNFQEMFNYCTSLTDTSLDNILQMCINATSYTGTKTLYQVGIRDTTVYPDSRIQNLSHYQDFIDAGWIIHT